MNRAAILALMLLPASALAQWPADWELGDYDWRDRALCVYSAIVERCLATRITTNNVLPPGTFTQRRRLVQYKDKIADEMFLDTYWVDTATETNVGHFSFIVTNASIFDDWIIPHLTLTGTVAQAGVVSNYLTRTPMFNAGSDTNYGWYPMKALLNKLTVTDGQTPSEGGIFIEQGFITSVLTNGYDQITTDDWATVRSDGISHYSNAGNWQATNFAVGGIYDFPFSADPRVLVLSPGYRLRMFANDANVRGVLQYSNMPTHCASRMDTYVTAFNNVTNHWSELEVGSEEKKAWFYEFGVVTNALVRRTKEVPLSPDGYVTLDLKIEADTNNITASSSPLQTAMQTQSDYKPVQIIHWAVTNGSGTNVGFKYVP